MGWSLGTGKNGRDIGYCVPAFCDHPDCNEVIDRGLAYLCGTLDSDNGCGLYFCENHRQYHTFKGEEYPCPECYGHGVVDDEAICEDCGGEGLDGEEECPTCGGSGDVWVEEECPECDGWGSVEDEDEAELLEVCDMCMREAVPYIPKEDHPAWLYHKLTDPSWEEWRTLNPAWMEKYEPRREELKARYDEEFPDGEEC